MLIACSGILMFRSGNIFVVQQKCAQKIEKGILGNMQYMLHPPLERRRQVGRNKT